MLNRIIKVSFAAVGIVTGFTLTNTFFALQDLDISYNFQVLVFVCISLVTGILFFTTGTKVIEMVQNALDRIETAIQSMTLYEITLSAAGLIAGLIIANLITIPVNKVSFIGVPISIAVNILCGCMGIYITSGKKGESLYEFFGGRSSQSKPGKFQSKDKILDTSAIIDGRIVDICRSGFMVGDFIVPSFVLEELRHIADSSDTLKRNRGRRGLDVLNVLQNEMKYPIRIENAELSEGSEVDSELLKMAEKLKCQVVTVDFNLNKVAAIHQVEVLNVNELANAVKPIALPGEEMTVQVIKDGKENGQGVGYLDDGTMIVVEGGRKFIGETVNVMVISVLQTAAGRMIFAKPKFSVEKVI